MGVASGRGQQEVGVASGWNLWVWLECIGVVSGCCCMEVYIVFHQMNAAATILFFEHNLRLQFEGGH